jgi:sugar/nucleoside kinase (ribokinase family)
MSANRTYRCLGRGEVLRDLLPVGKQLGGALANFTYHAHALGAETLVVSRVGNEALGREILEQRTAGLVHVGLSRQQDREKLKQLAPRPQLDLFG